MEYLENLNITYGDLKLSDGTIVSIGDKLDNLESHIINQIIETKELIKAFGVVKKRNGKRHAMVFEGYLYTITDTERFYIKGGYTYNPVCGKPLDSAWSRLINPNITIDCMKCQKRIKHGIV